MESHIFFKYNWIGFVRRNFHHWKMSAHFSSKSSSFEVVLGTQIKLQSSKVDRLRNLYQMSVFVSFFLHFFRFFSIFSSFYAVFFCFFHFPHFFFLFVFFFSRLNSDELQKKAFSSAIQKSIVSLLGLLTISTFYEIYNFPPESTFFFFLLSLFFSKMCCLQLNSLPFQVYSP